MRGFAFDSGPAPWQGSRRFRYPSKIEVASLANPELGAKQICPTCSSKFYDLTRRPAVCPKCGAEFDPEEAMRNRRVRARPPLPDDDVEQEKKPAAESEDGFEAEADDAPELDAVVNDPPILADDDTDEPDAPAAPGEALGVDFAEEDDIEAADDDDAVPFIEDEDDDDFPDDEIDGLPPEGASEDH
jgi:uncharacterized protein (TIGR02300 family)